MIAGALAAAWKSGHDGNDFSPPDIYRHVWHLSIKTRTEPGFTSPCDLPRINENRILSFARNDEVEDRQSC